MRVATTGRWGLRASAQDVQVNRGVLDQRQQAAVDVFDDHPLLGLSLPAALHQHVHLVRTRARPFQLPALRDAFNGLRVRATISLIWCASASTVSVSLQTDFTFTFMETFLGWFLPDFGNYSVKDGEIIRVYLISWRTLINHNKLYSVDVRGKSHGRFLTQGVTTIARTCAFSDKDLIFPDTLSTNGLWGSNAPLRNHWWNRKYAAEFLMTFCRGRRKWHYVHYMEPR